MQIASSSTDISKLFYWEACEDHRVAPIRKTGSQTFFFSVIDKWKSLSCVWLFATPWTIQSIEFSRPEYWSGQPFSSPGDLPNPGIEPRSPALQADSAGNLTHQESPRKPEWVAYPFSSGSSQRRNWIGVSCIADGLLLFLPTELPRKPMSLIWGQLHPFIHLSIHIYGVLTMLRQCWECTCKKDRYGSWHYETFNVVRKTQSRSVLRSSTSKSHFWSIPHLDQGPHWQVPGWCERHSSQVLSVSVQQR